MVAELPSSSPLATRDDEWELLEGAAPAPASTDDTDDPVVGTEQSANLRITFWKRAVFYLLRIAYIKRTWWAVGEYLKELKAWNLAVRQRVERDGDP